MWHNGWKVGSPWSGHKACPISFPSKNAPYLMYLIRLQASERLPVHQCFVDLICQVKVFKDPVHTGPPPAPGPEELNRCWGWEGAAATGHPQDPDSHGWVKDLPVSKAERTKSWKRGGETGMSCGACCHHLSDNLNSQVF